MSDRALILPTCLFLGSMIGLVFYGHSELKKYFIMNMDGEQFDELCKQFNNDTRYIKKLKKLRYSDKNNTN